MNVKGTVDLIRQFMIKNNIEYLDESGWNEVFYTELKADDVELALDLFTMHKYLIDHVAFPLVEELEEQGELVEYISHFGVDLDTNQLTVDIEMADGNRRVIEI